MSGEKTLAAIWNGIVVGFIAFKRGSHLSLLFVRKEFSGRGIGRELFLHCANHFNEVTVNATEAAVGFYQKVGFTQSGDRSFKHEIWGGLTIVKVDVRIPVLRYGFTQSQGATDG